MKCVTLRAFKAAIRRDRGAGRDLMIRKLFVTAPEPVPEDNGPGLIRFTITTDSVDREKDVVRLDGWQTEQFEKNPVVLWGHEQWEPPVGRSMRLFRDGGALKSDVKFVDEDVPVYGPRAEGIRQLCQRGFLSATSVGFRPLQFEVANDRGGEDDWFPPVNFLEQELLEFSVVSIPCNPEALIDPAQNEAGVLSAPGQEAAAAASLAAAVLGAVQTAKNRRRIQARLIAFS